MSDHTHKTDKTDREPSEVTTLDGDYEIIAGDSNTEWIAGYTTGIES